MPVAHPIPSSSSPPFGAWLPGVSAIFSLQQRNMTAFSRVAATVADAGLQIANKQVELVRALADAARINPLSIGGRSGSADAFKAQAEAGREFLDRMIRETREITDISRDCWSEIVQEFQNCAGDNLSGLQSALPADSRSEAKDRREGTIQAPSAPTPRVKAATA